jgi:DNA invertase Pin-like site-specific DNA recombinase
MTVTAIYVRTSPDCPVSAEDQIAHLKAVATDYGWTVSQIFSDRPTSVRKVRDQRPGEAGLIAAIKAGDVQQVLIFGIDRIGKSLVELVSFFEVCRAAGVSVYLHEQKLDTVGSNGLSLLDLTGMMAFHLRQSRRDKILRGQAAARSASVRFGRPPIPSTKIEMAKQLLREGKGTRQVGRLAGISAASASRLKGAMEQIAA